MLTRSPSTAAVAKMIGFAVLALGLILFVWHQFGGKLPLEPKKYRVTVYFDQAQNLQPNADVRMSGVTIGKVATVTPGTRRTTAVFDIFPEYAPLRQGARVITRVKTLLGETFVAMAPGAPTEPPIPDGGAVPIQNVGATQQLDEVLGAFDAPTRSSLRRLLESSATMFEGRAEDVNGTLARLGPASEDLDALATDLDRDQVGLSRFVERTGAVFDAINRRPMSLRSLVRDADAVLETTDRTRVGLRGTIDALVPLQRELRGSARGAVRTARVARPIVRTLRPASREAAAAVRGGRRLARELELLFREQVPVLRASPAGFDAGVRMNDAIRRLAPALLDSARHGLPLVDLLAAYRRDIVGGAGAYGAALQGTAPDGTGTSRHILKSLLTFNNESNGKTQARGRFNRHNAFPRPGWLDLLRSGLPSSDCRNVEAPTPPVQIQVGLGAPPCVVQGGWPFRGATQYYPALTKAP